MCRQRCIISLGLTETFEMISTYGLVYITAVLLSQYTTKWNTASFWKDMEFEFPNNLQKLDLFNDLCVNPLS